MTTELNEGERGLADCYQSLVTTLRDHRDDLAPFAERNALKAAASLWQVMNGLDQDPGQLYELGA